MVDQKLDSHTQERNLHKEIQCGGDEGHPEGAQKQRKDLHQYGGKSRDGQRKLQEPSVAFGVEGDHIQIKADGRPVKGQGKIDRQLCVDHQRKYEHEQDQAGSDNEQ